MNNLIKGIVLMAGLCLLAACAANVGRETDAELDVGCVGPKGAGVSREADTANPAEAAESDSDSVESQSAGVSGDGDPAVGGEAADSDPLAGYIGRSVQVQAIEPGGEAFTFAFEYEWTGQKWDEAYRVDLEISSESGFRQQFSFYAGIGAFPAYPELFESIVVPSWYITDFNFDGYRDILCLFDLAGREGTALYRGWLWNPTAQRFDEVALESYQNLSIDRKLGVLKSIHGDGEETWYELVRETPDGFVVTNRLRHSHGRVWWEYAGPLDAPPADAIPQPANGFVSRRDERYDEYALIDGEMMPVSEWVARDGEQVDIPYYAPDSIWFYDGTGDSFLVRMGSIPENNPRFGPMDVG